LKYQAVELEKHFGLETYETFHRGLDPQLGRFNSIDPKAELVYSVTPYASMNNNPAYYIDPLGDIFKVAKNSESKKDVLSIVDEKNSDYVDIDDEGNVKLDFGEMDKKSIKKLLKNDKGLALIGKLVDANEKYFYENGDEEKFSNTQEPDKLLSQTYTKEETEKNPHNAVSNISKF
jgi:RHS repeat-associated protein